MCSAAATDANSSEPQVQEYDIDLSVIGFIGLGCMGLPISSNLVSRGHQVIGYDINAAAMEAAEAAGVVKMNSVKELAQKATVVITVVPTGEDVKSVLFGEGVFKNTKQGNYIIDCSTIGYVAASEIITEAKKYGHVWMDIPVSGGAAGAKAATLSAIVGGTKHQFSEVQKLLKDVAKTVFHCGVAGMAQVAKIANSMILGITMLEVVEALKLAESFGMDMKLLTQILLNSSSTGYWLSVMHPIPGLASVPDTPPSNGYKGGLSARLLKECLLAAREEARFNGTKVPFSDMAIEAYDDLCKNGYGDLDFTSLYAHGCCWNVEEN